MASVFKRGKYWYLCYRPPEQKQQCAPLHMAMPDGTVRKTTRQDGAYKLLSELNQEDPTQIQEFFHNPYPERFHKPKDA